MRATICTIWALAGLLLVPGETVAAPLDYRCVAPLSTWGQVRQALAGPNYRVSGEITPVTLENISDPSLPLRVDANNNIPSTSRYVDVTILSAIAGGSYVSLTIRPRYGRDGSGQMAADVYVQFRRGEDSVDEDRQLRTIMTRGYLWESLPFSIVADADRVTIEAGGQRAEIPVALGPGATVEFNCTGGGFDFDEIAWSDEPETAGGRGSRR